MPQFFFDCVHRGCGEDCIGYDLADHREAHVLGIRFAGEILQHEAEAIADGHDLQVTVSDENRLILYSFHATTTPSAAVSRNR